MRSFSPVTFSVTRDEFLSAWRLLTRLDTQARIRKLTMLGPVILLVGAGHTYIAGPDEIAVIVFAMAFSAAIVAAAGYFLIVKLPEKWAYESFAKINESWDLVLTDGGLFLSNADPDIEIAALWQDLKLWNETEHVLMLSKVGATPDHLSMPLTLPKQQIGEERVQFIHNRLQIAEAQR